MLSIFIPTSPNPTTGWYAVVPESDVVDVKMSVEDAFKLVVSGGIVNNNLIQPSVSLLTTTDQGSDLPTSEFSRQAQSPLAVEEDAL